MAAAKWQQANGVKKCETGGQKTVRNRQPKKCENERKVLGSDFGRTDFSRIFIFGPPDFFADFLAGFFLLIFVGKSAQKNPPGESPAKSSKIYTTKIPDTFLQRGRTKKCKNGRKQATTGEKVRKRSGCFLLIVFLAMNRFNISEVPSTVRNFMASPGCSMEGALPKKETVPTVLGVARF